MPEGDYAPLVLAHLLPDHIGLPPSGGFVYRRAAIRRVFPLPWHRADLGPDCALRPIAALHGRLRYLETAVFDYRRRIVTRSPTQSFSLQIMTPAACIRRFRLYSLSFQLVEEEIRHLGLKRSNHLSHHHLHMSYARACFYSHLHAVRVATPGLPTLAASWSGLVYTLWTRSDRPIPIRLLFTAAYSLAAVLPRAAGLRLLLAMEKLRLRRAK